MVGNILELLALPGLPRFWQAAIYCLVGILAGLALLVVRISNAASYLSDSAETCINCHVMTDAYASWQRGSHGQVASCNDCHVPHDHILAKTAFKAMDGARHSYVFTFRKEPQVLTLSRGAVPVIQNNCIRCHDNQFQMIRLTAASERTCWSCHQTIHGDIHSLSASPRPLRPALPKAGIDLSQTGE